MIYPTYSDYGYRVVKPHQLPTTAGCSPAITTKLEQIGATYIPWHDDPIGCMLVQANPVYSGGLLNVGFRFALKKTWSSSSGNSLLEDFGSFVTAGFNAIGVGVDFLAAVYNGAVEGVKHIALEVALKALGPVCQTYPDECKKGISAGMTYAMASMGLPPSVPNWDQLKDEGVDYMAAVLGEQLEEETGIPSIFTETVLKEVAHKAIADMTGHRGGTHPTTSWYVRDGGFTPASWAIAVRKNGLAPLPIDVALFGQKTPLYGPTNVTLPHTFPVPPLRHCTTKRCVFR